ncbi:MAG: peptidoglycan-associated lipoprotein Pal [Candidatus Sumerlaeota bacterium]|nr:peptidoglycan-associated lipoprotein Pal [Candidatus Sumerlaeota bacterium]
MSRSTAAVARVALVVFALSVLTTGCSKLPKDHWWQFWRTGTPIATTPVGDDQFFAPPLEPKFPDGTGPSSLPGDPNTSGGKNVGIAEERPLDKEGGMIAELPMIYFDYDSYQLKPTEKDVLNKCAEWLIVHANVAVQVEGHCDERGTPEYNLNLGARRADMVREYLVSKGVAAPQLKTISYGKERPIDLGHSEDNWRKNRRVQFLVYQ